MTAAMEPATGGNAEFYDYNTTTQKYRRRLWLTRWWDDPTNRVLMIGLNPSFADADRADLTTTKNVEFAKRWGFGALDMLNLFDWIAIDEADVAGQQEAEHGCPDEPDEIGQLDDDYVLKIVWDEDSPDVVEAKTCAAWAAEKGRGLLVACEP